MKRFLFVTFAVVVALELSGCGLVHHAFRAASASASASPSATPTNTPNSEPSPTAAIQSDAKTFDSICQDATGDGSGSADIATVHLQGDGSRFHVTYTLASNVQPSDLGSVSFLTTAFSADGNHGYQFGSEFDGASQTANFVFDFDTAKQKNEGTALWGNGQAQMEYPLRDLPKLGAGFHWYAVLSLDSGDVDFCGGPLQDAIVVSG